MPPYKFVDAATNLPVATDGKAWDNIDVPAGQNIQIWNSPPAPWKLLSPGTFKRPDVPIVAPPPAGLPGDSAYQVWVKAGNPGGTVAQFLASLKGTPGAQGIPGPQGIPGTSVTGGVPADFVAAAKAAFAADSQLNWTGGDYTLGAPLRLSAIHNMTGFGIRFNGAKITSNFNDATQHAITVDVAVTNGAVAQNVNVRNLHFHAAGFRGASAFAGGIKLECLSNGSWIYSFLEEDLSCEGHSEYGFRWNGSVFECVGKELVTIGGKGGLYIQTRGVKGVQGESDQGLPSAMYLYNPNFRDGAGDSIVLQGDPYNDPFDLTIKDGYIVTNAGVSVRAPSGIKKIDGTGFENNGGGTAISLGYRGGTLINCTAANARPNPSLDPPVGMKYLVDCFLANGRLTIQDSGIQDEPPSSGGTKLARVNGTGDVYLERSGTRADVDGSGPTFHVS